MKNEFNVQQWLQTWAQRNHRDTFLSLWLFNTTLKLLSK